MICRNPSLLWAGTVECNRKQSLYRSSKEMIAFVNSYRLRIWYLGSSWSTTSRKGNPIRPFGKVIWWFLLFSINIGRLSSDRVHKVFIKCRPIRLKSGAWWEMYMRVCRRTFPATGTFSINTHRIRGSNSQNLWKARIGFVLVKTAEADWLRRVLLFNSR